MILDTAIQHENLSDTPHPCVNSHSRRLLGTPEHPLLSSQQPDAVLEARGFYRVCGGKELGSNLERFPNSISSSRKMALRRSIFRKHVGFTGKEIAVPIADYL